ncbi:hypothetical protein B0H13DRAFT_1024152 [Mycena leptocephala]|nr:hypothetical protein B0H13DRAFT_1024152 [Mycena leptocephala]
MPPPSSPGSPKPSPSPPSPSPAKKTVLVYGHLDVQPAVKSDGWDTEPFVLTEEKDVGRGSSDAKGPVVGWFGVLQWHYEHKKEMPVNLVMCFEGMEERGRRTRGSRMWIVFASATTTGLTPACARSPMS